MKTIEIVTPQNVVIEYEFGAMIERGIAMLIDITVVYLPIYGVLLLFKVEPDFFTYGFFPLIAFILITAIQTYYFHGITLGKLLFKLRVIREDGEELDFSSLALRSVFLLVDLFLSSGIIACFLIITSPKSQRLGDMASRMLVIRQKEKSMYDIQSLKRINELDTYKPSYEKVYLFSEEEVILIKTTISRYEKYKNPAHEQALNQLTTKVAEGLGLVQIPQDKLGFLRTVIKDYIVLTR